MSRFTKGKFLIIILCSLLTIHIFSRIDDNVNNTHFENPVLESSETSEKISVVGDSGWIGLKISGKCIGSGTDSDPYVIKDLEINSGNSGSCIRIEDSNVYFKIENCSLSNSGGVNMDNPYAGIQLENVINGDLTKNVCYNNYVGIFIRDCDSIRILDNNVNNNDQFGIIIWNVNNSIVSTNTLRYNSQGLGLDESNHNTILNNHIEYNYIGIGIGFHSNYNVISRNSITNNNIGIEFGTVKCNTLTNNVFNNNEDDTYGTQEACNVLSFSMDIILLIIIISILILGVTSILLYRKRRSKRVGKKQELEKEKDIFKKEEDKEDLPLKPKLTTPLTEISQKSLTEEIIKSHRDEVEPSSAPIPEIQQDLTCSESQTAETQISEIKEPSSSNSPTVIPQIDLKEDLEHEKIPEELSQVPVSELLSLKVEEPKPEILAKPKPQELHPIPSILYEKELRKPLSVKVEEETSRVAPKEKEPDKEINLSDTSLDLKQLTDYIQYTERKGKEGMEEKEPHFCTNCGKLLINTWKICAYCGVKIRKELWKENLEPEIEKLPIKKEEAISTIKPPETTEFKESFETTISSLKEDVTQIERISKEEIKIITEDKADVDKVEPTSPAEIKTKEMKEEVPVSSQDLSRMEKSIKRFAIKSPTIEDEIITKEKTVISKPIKNVCPFCGYTNDLDKNYCYQCGYKLKK